MAGPNTHRAVSHRQTELRAVVSQVTTLRTDTNQAMTFARHSILSGISLSELSILRFVHYIVEHKPVSTKCEVNQSHTGQRCPEGSRILRFPDYVTMAQNGRKVVSLTHRPPLPPGNTPGTHFCQRLSRPQDHSEIGRIISVKNSNDTLWNRTSDLPICGAAP